MPIPIDWGLVDTTVLLALGSGAVRYVRRVDRVHMVVFGNGKGGGLQDAVTELTKATAGLHEAVTVLQKMDERKKRGSDALSA